MHKVSRRKFICNGASTAFALPSGMMLSGPARAVEISTKEGLTTLAARSEVTFGAAAAREIFADASYRKLYINETKAITTDYALKFDAIRPDEAVFRFEGGDALVQFAAENKLGMRGHTLVWNENLPDWLIKKSGQERTKILDGHIDTVVSRYLGRIDIWDVVNEPFWPGHGKPGGFRQGAWFDTLGKDYVARALTRTAKIDPAVKLAINEAHTERSDDLGLSIRAGLLRLIDDLQNAGIPLHIIGLQGHLQPQFPSNDAVFVAFLREIAARKLEIHITELDIDDSTYTGTASERDRAAAKRVYDFLGQVLTVPQVSAVNTWQLSDRYSWYQDPDIRRRSSVNRAMRPLPFDDDMARKPMWLAMAKAFSERMKKT